jgi:hypothetical protein
MPCPQPRVTGSREPLLIFNEVAAVCAPSQATSRGAGRNGPRRVATARRYPPSPPQASQGVDEHGQWRLYPCYSTGKGAIALVSRRAWSPVLSGVPVQTPLCGAGRAASGGAGVEGGDPAGGPAQFAPELGRLEHLDLGAQGEQVQHGPLSRLEPDPGLDPVLPLAFLTVPAR